MKDEQTTCTPCEQNFENKVNELVEQVEDYTHKDRIQKEPDAETDGQTTEFTPRTGKFRFFFAPTGMCIHSSRHFAILSLYLRDNLSDVRYE